MSDLLNNALTLTTGYADDEKLEVGADDVEGGGKIDYALHFFEPQPNHTYTIKFLPSLNKDNKHFTQTKVYTKLPDPDRRGKSFWARATGIAGQDAVLETFFALHERKKNGDQLAEKIIDTYLGSKSQGCCLIQILTSTNKDDVGKIRLFAYTSAGKETPIKDLIALKTNPSEANIIAGHKKEDILNIFGSPVLILDCKTEKFKDTEGRSYKGSSWKLGDGEGAISILPDGTSHKFSKADLGADGNIKHELVEKLMPFVNNFIEQLKHPDVDVYQWFAHKKVGDPRNTEDINKHLEKVQSKLDRVLPLLLNAKSMDEIAKFGTADTSTTGNAPKVDKAKNMMAEALPDELAGSIMGGGEVKQQATTPTQAYQATPPTQGSEGNLEDLL